MDTPDNQNVDGWVQWILGAILGAFVMLISVVKAWVGIKHTADDALAMSKANAEHVGVLQLAHATSDANYQNLVKHIDERMEELREGHKEILRRLK